MNHRSCLHSVTLAACTFAPMSGQTSATSGSYPVKECWTSRTMFGVLPEASGWVSYSLHKDGKPDTASITVRKVDGMSAAGFRSVAVRKLRACRHEMGRPAPRAPVEVSQQISFADSSKLEVSVATTVVSDTPPLALEPFDISKDSFPLPISDSRIEERPRRLDCLPLPGGVMPLPSPPGVDDGRRWMRENAAKVYSGWLIAQVRVGVDGKPGTAIRVLDASSPADAQKFARMIGGCQFVPARYHGVVVPAFIQLTL